MPLVGVEGAAQAAEPGDLEDQDDLEDLGAAFRLFSFSQLFFLPFQMYLQIHFLCTVQ
jgi:hypothetical protein